MLDEHRRSVLIEMYLLYFLPKKTQSNTLMLGFLLEKAATPQCDCFNLINYSVISTFGMILKITCFKIDTDDTYQ